MFVVSLEWYPLNKIWIDELISLCPHNETVAKTELVLVEGTRKFSRFPFRRFLRFPSVKSRGKNSFQQNSGQSTNHFSLPGEVFLPPENSHKLFSYQSKQTTCGWWFDTTYVHDPWWRCPHTIFVLTISWNSILSLPNWVSHDFLLLTQLQTNQAESIRITCCRLMRLRHQLIYQSNCELTLVLNFSLESFLGRHSSDSTH